MNLKISLLSAVFFCLTQAFADSRVTFDDLPIGSSMSGWSSGFFGVKGAPLWKVARNDHGSGNVLTQTGQATYSWLVKDGVPIKNGTIESKFNILSGKHDPEAGLVWRHRDGKNYYYVRANAIEDNIVFYRMNSGKKETVKEADMKVPFNTWHEMKVTFYRDEVAVFFDGKLIISTRDTALPDPGKVGLFTTADTITLFDDINWSEQK